MKYQKISTLEQTNQHVQLIFHGCAPAPSSLVIGKEILTGINSQCGHLFGLFLSNYLLLLKLKANSDTNEIVACILGNVL